MFPASLSNEDISFSRNIRAECFCGCSKDFYIWKTPQISAGRQVRDQLRSWSAFGFRDLDEHLPPPDFNDLTNLRRRWADDPAPRAFALRDEPLSWRDLNAHDTATAFMHTASLGGRIQTELDLTRGSVEEFVFAGVWLLRSIQGDIHRFNRGIPTEVLLGDARDWIASSVTQYRRTYATYLLRWFEDELSEWEKIDAPSSVAEGSAALGRLRSHLFRNGSDLDESLDSIVSESRIWVVSAHKTRVQSPSGSA